jgi:glycosyltransferase involved in cell wall biosynthesis
MVELLGIVSNMSKEYINASILVLTSRGEGLPMVLIEAQAFGLPVVSFDCKTGPAEIITDSKDGFLIPSFDTNLMGERIVNLCDDYHLRLQFGSCARNNAKRFLPENIVAKWEKLFDSLQKL